MALHFAACFSIQPTLSMFRQHYATLLAHEYPQGLLLFISRISAFPCTSGLTDSRKHETNWGPMAQSSIDRELKARANEYALLLTHLRRLTRKTTGRRLSALSASKAVIDGNHPSQEVRAFFDELPSDDKHYWIATYFALLMPEKKRRKLGAYFTPPHLAKYSIEKLIVLGIRPGNSRILDPSSGGAAFLVPLAHAIVQDARRRQLEPRGTLNRIQKTIAGIEIDKSLVKLSELLLADLLAEELTRTRRKLQIPITNGDTLENVEPTPTYDAVVGNPPYGRIFQPTKNLLSRFAGVISDGYVNKYALFVQRSIAWTRPGGVICLIVPMSFLGGPYFAALRKHILEQTVVISLDPIEERSALFMDVLCDVCVLTLRKKDTLEQLPVVPTSSLVHADRPSQRLGDLDLPAKPASEYGHCRTKQATRHSSTGKLVPTRLWISGESRILRLEPREGSVP